MEPKPYNDMDAADLLALCVWRESRGEPDAGKLGVAYSVINRVQRPCWWGNTIHTVVLKPYQYSSFNPDDVNADLWPQDDDPSWKASQEAAQAAIGNEPDPTEGATHYHATDIDFPKGWGNIAEYQQTLLVSGHVFYKYLGKP
jgi:spore germination cell wall hydrolase CwlJ-like protein